MENPKVWILNGPNLNKLGRRNTDIYGTTTLEQIEESCLQVADALGLDIMFMQSNWEVQLVEWIQQAQDLADGLLINAAAYTHTSIAIHDALEMLTIPVVEVHLSNLAKREAFRHTSYVSPVVQGMVMGFGPESYRLGLYAVSSLISKNSLCYTNSRPTA